MNTKRLEELLVAAEWTLNHALTLQGRREAEQLIDVLFFRILEMGRK